MENSVVYFNGQEFANEQALHEWRLAFDFQYFLDYNEELFAQQGNNEEGMDFPKSEQN